MEVEGRGRGKLKRSWKIKEEVSVEVEGRGKERLKRSWKIKRKFRWRWKGGNIG